MIISVHGETLKCPLPAAISGVSRKGLRRRGPAKKSKQQMTQRVRVS